METWASIDGYEGWYEVSDYGRVRRIKSSQGTSLGVLKANIAPNGYCFVIFSRKSKRKRAYIHRLVASAFIDGRSDQIQVNYIDGVKTNNHVNNLEWVTPAENVMHALSIGLIKTGLDSFSSRFPEKIQRGDDHWTRRMPERVARGDNHWTRK